MQVLCMQFRGSFSFLLLTVLIINSYCLPCILVNKDYLMSEVSDDNGINYNSIKMLVS